MFLLTWRLHNWKENDVFVIWHRTELQTHTKTTGRASGVKWRRWWRQRHWQPNWVGNLASSQIISMNAFINVPTKPRIWMDSYHCWKDQASFMFQFGGLRQLAFTMASSWVWHWGCLQCVSATYFLIQAYQIVTDQKEPLNNCCCCCCCCWDIIIFLFLIQCSRLSWPLCQLLSTIFNIVSYDIEHGCREYHFHLQLGWRNLPSD